MSTAFYRRSLWLFALLALAASAATSAFAAELSAFTPKSLAEIKTAQKGRPFVLAFWSVTCEPCREEMAVLIDIHRQFPSLPILLVAADPPAQRAEVIQALRSYKLAGIDTWQFQDDEVERLRYSVDRTWVGELPRTYFFNATHTSTPRTGAVDPAWVKKWIERDSGLPRQ